MKEFILIDDIKTINSLNKDLSNDNLSNDKLVAFGEIQF